MDVYMFAKVLKVQNYTNYWLSVESLFIDGTTLTFPHHLINFFVV